MPSFTLTKVSFQFYNSPIKTVQDVTQLKKLYSFNSTIVRLKLSALRASSSAFACFNSTIVRLKQELEGKMHRSEDGFNSTIVRLKLRQEDNPTTEILKFQFYNSPIKTLHIIENKVVGNLFQFYNSPIKTNLNLIETISQYQVSILQ